ncbi:AAA family ATPase [Nocardioides panacis]|uniref:AAA family ATPase n=1 Tax=Nocardioides panacis TaxID=2849501 RepID=A0A975Y213_9ACTN|nr:AAA family ATPase [Nocardioides panacis]QWZ09979.1 AAA family ATPase [Nocardioides panacis]
MLHGRDVELARLAALVDDARHGTAGSVVVHGEPGAGKSALLREALSSADDVRVLRTQGLESESPLAFAALHRLLRPVLDLVARLPAPQAHALRVAFGQETGTAEPFLVGVATLSMLTEAAEDQPVVCVVDDAHWLDSASADALLFATRRLDADPVAVVFAARDSDARTFAPDGVPSVRLSGLDAASVRALLAENVPVAVPIQVSDRLVAETGGNPLALVELPTVLSEAQLDGSAALPPQLLLTSGVERVFLDRCRRLSDPAQTVMLVAVADDTGRLIDVQVAAAALGVGPDAVAEAERSGLLVLSGDTVTVRHPLVRSAVYQAATGLERRRAHRALADALDGVGDSDRATWHRAAAADGPDENLVAALDQVGARAGRRGGYRAAADAHERAADLTVDPHAKAGRQLAAARNAWASGQTARASTLLGAARERADDPLLLADVDRLRGRIAVNLGSAADAHRIFTRAAEQVAAHDPVRALEMAVAAAIAHSHGIDSGARLGAETIDVGVSPHDTPRTRCLKQLLVSTRLDIAGDRAAALRELRIAQQTALGAGDTLADLDLLGNLANAALHLGDDESHRRFYALMLSTARENGDGMAVLYALQRVPFSQYVGGQWAALRNSSEEAVTLALSVGQVAATAAPRAWLTLLAALEGRPDYDERLAVLEDLVAAHPPVGILAQPVEDLTRWAKAVRALLAGDAAGALHHFRRMAAASRPMQLPALMLMSAQDRVDAAVGADDHTQAAAWVADLEVLAAGTDLPWVHAATAFGRARTSEHGDASGGDRVPELFETSLAHHAAAHRPYDRARVQLGYGQYLRRSQRRVDARIQLRAALDTFEDLHVEALVERAAQELRASGESARRRDPSTLLDLTPMELKVAALVSQGLSNKDVAAQCWVSPRTVAFHLRNVFTKTGVTSRGELVHLGLDDPAPVPA